MRLLQRNDAGDYILTEFIGDNIPHYAILSHTWGADDEEVTLEDLRNGISKSKAGYTKLQFCADRATRDNLRYFWVDTCCIDRSSSAELSEAVNSMFAWYRNAARCYVYLSDVATGSLTNAAPAQQDWHLAFQQSRWFTRGWTIQELVAPASVEFFSIEGHRLGDKNSLIQELHSITGIGVEALRGRPLVEFSVDERMSWVEQRHTRRAEDAAYSLLGIFDVYMPILYGEGRNRAFARLRKEIQAWNSDTSHPGPIHDVNFKTHHEGHVDSPLTTTDLNLEVVATPYSDSDDGSEIVSVFSDGETSISSASTANLNPVQTVGIREVSRALLSKQDVKAIYSMAIFNVERRKARSHIRGFLKDYGRNLLKEASSSSLAIQAAKFVHELAGRISDEIIWNITGSAALPDSPKSGFKKRGLETWLSTLQSEGIGIDESNPTGTRADGDEISEEGESDEELNNDLPFPNIDKVKDFLLNSEAFQEHIMAMRTWLKVDGVDRKDVNKSATDTAEHINTEELTKEILEDLNATHRWRSKFISSRIRHKDRNQELDLANIIAALEI
ncbi:hypothetical protein J4E91_010797 [Alternaria rosae]|nr:hypothetical protein J4E91_010797 [Alternaria rosae]